MSNYLLDTNILLLLLRQDARWETLETQFELPLHRLSLITADLDFNHLSPDFLNLNVVDLSNL
jgi:hypothetical protein